MKNRIFPNNPQAIAGPLGLTPEPLGLTPKPLGLNPKPLGLNPKARGLNPEAWGLNPIAPSSCFSRDFSFLSYSNIKNFTA
jgi:hypothetical protein